ncbi:MAG: hypothetical protein R2819_09035 [Allomuricauda sp.]
MAEVFRGQHHSIYTSNNGGQALLHSLIQISKKIGSNPPIIKIRTFLEQQLKKGHGSFSLDPKLDFPEALKDQNTLKALLTVVKAMGHELTKPNPNLPWDIDWHREIRLRWLAKMVQFYKMVTDLMPKASLVASNLEVSLDEVDSTLFRYYLHSDYYKELCRRYPKKNVAQKLDLLNRLIPIIKVFPDKREELLLRFSERAELFISQGKNKKAVQDMKQCIALTRDPIERGLFKEYVAQFQ